MMTPTWVFPAYPLLLTAPFAANIINAAIVSGHRHSINSTAVALCAAATQGTGCLIAFMISAAFIYRLMTQKLPRDMQRPGVVSYAFSQLSLLLKWSTDTRQRQVHLHWAIWVHGRRNW